MSGQYTKTIPVSTRRRAPAPLDEIAEKIDVPVMEWPGRCHEIISLLAAAGLVPSTGRLRYGMWVGPIDKGSPFAGKGFCHHGWYEVKPATDCPNCHHGFNVQGPCCEKAGSEPALVMDATRWVFENCKPYIFAGHDAEGYYDVAGDRIRQAFSRPYPMVPEPWEQDQPKRPDVGLVVGKPYALYLAVIISENGGPALMLEDDATKLTVSNRGLGWLANLPLSVLKGAAKPLFDALEKLGQSALVPMDSRETVKGDGWYGQKEKYAARVEKAARKRK